VLQWCRSPELQRFVILPDMAWLECSFETVRQPVVSNGLGVTGGKGRHGEGRKSSLARSGVSGLPMYYTFLVFPYRMRKIHGDLTYVDKLSMGMAIHP
jgi:hypothetical protein